MAAATTVVVDAVVVAVVGMLNKTFLKISRNNFEIRSRKNECVSCIFWKLQHLIVNVFVINIFLLLFKTRRPWPCG